MSVLTMRILPDPILRRQARKVGKVPANMKKFTDDMIETMHAELEVGLAANQIGSLQKVAVIQLPDWEEALVLINPEIVRQEGEREVVEGCLSIPGYRGLVKRSVSVRARAIGLDGKVIRIRRAAPRAADSRTCPPARCRHRGRNRPAPACADRHR